jgi:hypothetical protein
VPRIVDDCMASGHPLKLFQFISNSQLTLSNCHRERFHLKGPKESENLLSSDLDELSKHNGFDPRLCFGDIVLGFRFFADGLPEELREKDDQEAAEMAQQPSTRNSAQTPSPPAINGHKWIGLNPKQGKQQFVKYILGIF